MLDVEEPIGEYIKPTRKYHKLLAIFFVFYTAVFILGAVGVLVYNIYLSNTLIHATGKITSIVEHEGCYLNVTWMENGKEVAYYHKYLNVYSSSFEKGQLLDVYYDVKAQRAYMINYWPVFMLFGFALFGLILSIRLFYLARYNPKFEEDLKKHGTKLYCKVENVRINYYMHYFFYNPIELEMKFVHPFLGEEYSFERKDLMILSSKKPKGYELKGKKVAVYIKDYEDASTYYVDYLDVR